MTSKEKLLKQVADTLVEYEDLSETHCPVGCYIDFNFNASEETGVYEFNGEKLQETANIKITRG